MYLCHSCAATRTTRKCHSLMSHGKRVGRLNTRPVRLPITMALKHHLRKRRHHGGSLRKRAGKRVISGAFKRAFFVFSSGGGVEAIPSPTPCDTFGTILQRICVGMRVDPSKSFKGPDGRSVHVKTVLFLQLQTIKSIHGTTITILCCQGAIRYWRR